MPGATRCAMLHPPESRTLLRFKLRLSDSCTSSAPLHAATVVVGTCSRKNPKKKGCFLKRAGSQVRFRTSSSMNENRPAMVEVSNALQPAIKNQPQCPADNVAGSV